MNINNLSKTVVAALVVALSGLSPSKGYAQCDHPASYAAVGSSTTAPSHYPIKRVRIAFHIFRDENGQNNMPDNSSTTAINQYIGLIMNHMNTAMSNQDPPVQNGVSLDGVADTKIRFVNTGIFYHNDVAGSARFNTIYNDNRVDIHYYADQKGIFDNFIKGGSQTYWVGAESFGWEDVYHVILINSGLTFTVTTAKVNGRVPTVGVTTSSNAYTGIYNVHDVFDPDHPTDNTYSNWWGPASVIVHEFGHSMGLQHTSQKLHYTAVNPELDINQWDITCFDAWKPSCSHNLLMGWGSGMSLTKEEQGIIYANLHHPSDAVLSIRNHQSSAFRVTDDWVMEDWCTRDATATITIPTGTSYIWNDTKYLEGDLVIENGAILIIKCYVSIPKDGKIIVKDGGKLIVEGGTLTNVCGNAWEGIHMESSPVHNVNDYINGVYASVELLNGATVEHAKIGILNGDLGGFGTGIIEAKNATFSNCRKAIEIHALPELLENQFVFPLNKSRIINCRFECTAPIRDRADNAGTGQFISAWEHAGLQVSGCTFINTATANDYGDNYLGTGVVIGNGRFYAGKGGNYDPTACAFDGAGNTFTNLHVGINFYAPAYNLDDKYFLDVYENTFTNCVRGVEASGSLNYSFWKNEFIWDPAYQDHIAKSGLQAIWLQDNQGPWINDNKFNVANGLQLPFNPWANIVDVENSFNSNNTIYFEITQNQWLNGFSATNVVSNGVKLSGNNSQLKFYCNEFPPIDRFSKDVFAPAGSLPGTIGSANQSAGNKFTAHALQFDNATNSSVLYFGDWLDPAKVVGVNVILNPDGCKLDGSAWKAKNPCDYFVEIYGVSETGAAQKGSITQQVPLDYAEVLPVIKKLAAEGNHMAHVYLQCNYDTAFFRYAPEHLQQPTLPALTAVDEIEASAFKVYPNPVGDKNFTIESTQLIQELKIVDVQGRVLYSSNRPGYSFMFPSTVLPAKGVYLIHLKYEDKSLIHRLVK